MLFFFQAEDGIRDKLVTGVQTCALPIYGTALSRFVLGVRGAPRLAEGWLETAMCGICGIFEYDRRADIPGEMVHRMNQTMIHRGPDDGGVFVGPGIGLGHRRLSIIDLAGGHQPMSNEDGTIWVLLNGEIYNYPELRSELLGRGHKFTTKSDRSEE